MTAFKAPVARANGHPAVIKAENISPVPFGTPVWRGKDTVAAVVGRTSILQIRPSGNGIDLAMTCPLRGNGRERSVTVANS